jgi:hypothetical protein
VIHGVDTTFLVQVELLECPGHAAARAWLHAAMTQGSQPFALAPQVLTAFVHVATDPRRFRQPLTMDAALDKAQVWWEASEVRRFIRPSIRPGWRSYGCASTGSGANACSIRNSPPPTMRRHHAPAHAQFRRFRDFRCIQTRPLMVRRVRKLSKLGGGGATRAGLWQFPDGLILCVGASLAGARRCAPTVPIQTVTGIATKDANGREEGQPAGLVSPDHTGGRFPQDRRVASGEHVRRVGAARSSVWVTDRGQPHAAQGSAAPAQVAPWI